MIVLSSDTEVGIYCLTYIVGSETKRDIPILMLANNLGGHFSFKFILKTNVLSGCDGSSKIGAKYSATKNNLMNNENLLINLKLAILCMLVSKKQSTIW